MAGSFGIVILGFFLFQLTIVQGHPGAARFSHPRFEPPSGRPLQHDPVQFINGLDDFSFTNSSIYNVLDYGAISNGTGENVIAFQKALDEAGSRKGGIVYVPPGQYKFQTATQMNIPKGVTLMGSYGNVPSQSYQIGSTLVVTGGSGIDEICFIQLSEDSTLTRLSIFYPGQKQVQKNPAKYPWSVCLSGNNPAVTDLHCVNCYNAIRAQGTNRHYLARIHGQPINTGVFVSNTNDLGTLQDIHFKPWYSNDQGFKQWQLKYGRAFIFAGSSWQHVSNTFASQYAIGYHFIKGSNGGSADGHFIGIGADQSSNASVQVESTDNAGILITNGMFTTGGGKPNASHVIVTSSNTGNVQFSNSVFFGGSVDHIARINGSGTVSFSQCAFNSWDSSKKGKSAILVDNDATGNLVVVGCDFQADALGAQIELGNGTLSKAVIMGNLMKGYAKIVGKAKNTQTGLNAADDI